MKIIFLSIEFSIGTFSGNGIYAISQVRALRQLGHQVLVISGRPESSTSTASPTDDADLISIPLPIWNRLDLECSWKEYALGCGTPSIVTAVQNFDADVVLGVDWHSYAAYQNLIEALEANQKISNSTSISFQTRIPPYACSNYRVYLRSLPEDNKQEEIMRKLEGESLLRGICSFVLSASDKNFVEKNYFSNLPSAPLLAPPLHVVLPALRADLAAIPLPQTTQEERKYLLCCVRASPEKEPHRFVDLICELQKRDFFDKNGIVPLLVGSGWKVENKSLGLYQEPAAAAATAALSPLDQYVLKLRQRVETHVPCCHFIETFLGPMEMAQIYSQTALNIHPPAYDAYGMTIIEGASQKTPSLVAFEGHVGATDLLNPEKEEIFVTNMEDSVQNLANVVEKLFENRKKLKQVGETAAVVARKWNEEANAAAVTQILTDSLALYSQNTAKKAILPLSQGEGAVPFRKLTHRRGGIDVLVSRSSSESKSNEGEDTSLQYTYFEENYLAMNTPVIFSGIATTWLATKEWFDPGNSGTSGGIAIEKLEGKFGTCRVLATDSARRHRGEGPCKEMSVAEYCQWWKDRKQQKDTRKINPLLPTGGDDGGGGGDEEDHLWYLKDWHFVKDTATQTPSVSTKPSDYYYYELPRYFSDDWLNEWYDSLSGNTSNSTAINGISTSCTTIISTSTNPTQTEEETTATTPQPAATEDYRFLYLGPQGSSTPLHTDVLRSHSWSANIVGRKLWRLLPAEYAHLVQDKSTGMSHPYDFYPEEEKDQQKLEVDFKKNSTANSAKDATLHPSSQDTPFTSINARFPGLKEAQTHIIEVIQYPGEIIFVPSGWYHTVLNLDDCLSINHNWISSHSVMSSLRLLQKERARAADLIDDCRCINGAAEFELLVQRNVEMNAGVGYTKFGAMVRYIATKAAVACEEKERVHFARLTAAEKILNELVEEQEKVFLNGESGGGSEDEISEEEKAAREALLTDIRLNKECLKVIAAALSQKK
jgi:hypothetical protein